MPKTVKRKVDKYADLEEDQGGIITMLITFVVMMVVAALICTIVWKVTHKEPRAQIGNMQVQVSPSWSETLVAEDELSHAQSNDTEKEVEPINGDTDMVFEAVDEEVTAKDAAIIRIQPDTEGIITIAGQLRNGQILRRTGINKETGWSRVIFNGGECFIISYYLTTDKNYKAEAPANPDNRVTTADGYIISFTDCEEIVTVATQEYVNLRTEPSTTQGKATISAQLKAGLTAKRTGISKDSGWSRVEFNGLVLYVVSKYVTVVSDGTVTGESEE